MNASSVNPEEIIAGLKDFQCDTVDYVFRRLYLDEDPADRFLVADEVGLGKTLVARGVIARALEHLRKAGERVDVLYICSNADIARQNISKLNLTGREEFALSSRITLLPMSVSDLNDELNFISFTPKTSFDLVSAEGRKTERMLLYWMLKEVWPLSGTGPKNLLQAGVRDKDRWRRDLSAFRSYHKPAPTWLPSSSGYWSAGFGKTMRPDVPTSRTALRSSARDLPRTGGTTGITEAIEET